MEAVNPYAAPSARLTSGHKRCESCGAEILAKAEICPKCGVRQRNPVSKPVLLLLTFFTGGIGGHKFYLGKHWQGVLYLLLCWTGIPGLIALIEFVIYACTSSERLNEKYTASSGIAIVLILIVVGIFAVGILAAIALPAYQDYTHRARVSEALIKAAPWKLAVAEHYAGKRRLPSSAAELDRSTRPADAGSRSSSVDLGANGALTITMAVAGTLAGKTIVLQPTVAGDALRWDCTAGTLEPRYRPSECRPR